MIYVDNPSGVGYSYAERDIDIITNDDQFAQDALSFATQFFSDWPEYRLNPVFISGHSYGGIYAPYLTWKMHL